MFSNSVNLSKFPSRWNRWTEGVVNEGVLIHDTEHIWLSWKSYGHRLSTRCIYLHVFSTIISKVMLQYTWTKNNIIFKIPKLDNFLRLFTSRIIWFCTHRHCSYSRFRSVASHSIWLKEPKQFFLEVESGDWKCSQWKRTLPPHWIRFAHLET